MLNHHYIKEKGLVKAMVLFCLFAFLPSSVFALTKADADSSYVNENYQQAISQYEQLLKEGGANAELYYNLGNAYYRMDDITHAVLNYERAQLLSPGDADIRFNLQLARSKTVDRIVPQSEFFIVTWYRSVVNRLSIDGWASSPIWLRKVGFFGCGIMVCCFVLAIVFAWQQKHMLDHRDGAIIIESAVPVKSTPAQNGTDLFILHEGTKVSVLDNSIGDWCEIRVPDGKQGWVEVTQIEVI